MSIQINSEPTSRRQESYNRNNSSYLVGVELLLREPHLLQPRGDLLGALQVRLERGDLLGDLVDLGLQVLLQLLRLGFVVEGTVARRAARLAPCEQKISELNNQMFKRDPELN